MDDTIDKLNNLLPIKSKSKRDESVVTADVEIQENNTNVKNQLTEKTSLQPIPAVPEILPVQVTSNRYIKFFKLLCTLLLSGGTLGILVFGATTFLGTMLAISLVWLIASCVAVMFFLWGIANYIILSHNDRLSVNYSLQQIEKSIMNNDTELIKKYVDYDRLVEQAYNAFGIVKEKQSGTGYLFRSNHQYRKGFINRVRRFWQKVEGRIYSPEIKNALLQAAFDKLANRDVQIFDDELRTITRDFYDLIGIDNFKFVKQNIRKGDYSNGRNTVVEFTVLNTRGNVNKEYVLNCNMGKSPMVVDDDTNLFPDMVNHVVFAKWLTHFVIFISNINPFTDLVFYECKILDIQRFSEFILNYQSDVEEFDIAVDKEAMALLEEQIEVKNGLVILSYKRNMLSSDEYFIQFAVEVNNKFDSINMLKCDISFDNEDGQHQIKFQDIMFKKNLPDKYSDGVVYSQETKINTDGLSAENEYIVNLLNNVYEDEIPIMGKVKRNFEKKDLVIIYSEHIKLDVVMVKWAHYDPYIRPSNVL
ncbi:MAG: hypothetical protein MJ048_02770 [Acidaminococcaceae bacterium]|nr:hypothetical protein [Acidaminococcaceae bacterium]